jgi:hypothetical protein
MATATPIIQTIFTVADRASPVFVKINQRMTVINRTAQQTQQRMDAVGRSLGGLGAAVGFGAMVTGFKKAIDITSDYEQQVLRLTGVMEGMAAKPTHQEALSASVSAYKILNQYAAALPGETEDYVTVFERGLPEALRAGVTDIKDIAKFTSHFAAVMMDAKHNADNVGESLNKMLSLHPRMMQRDIVIRMLRIMNMSAAAFRALDPAQRLQAVRKALSTMDGMIKEQANSIEALFGATVSNAKMVLVGGIKPVLEEIRHGVKAVSEYLEKNNESLSKTVALSGLLIIKLAKVAAVAKGVSMIGGLPMLQRVGSLGVAGVTKTAGAVSRGIGAAGAAARGVAGVGEAMDIFSKWSIVGRVMSMFIASAPIIAGLATAIAGFGIVITMAGILRQLFSDLVDDIGGIRTRLLESINNLVESITNLIPKIDGVSTGLGDFLVRFINNTGDMIEVMKSTFIYLYTLITTFSNKKAMEASDRSWLEYLARLDAAAQRQRDLGLFDTTAVSSKLAGRETPDMSGKGKGTEIKFYNARFDIKQQFAEGFDPDRIAVAFANGIAKMGEMKVYSQFTPAYTNSN